MRNIKEILSCEVCNNEKLKTVLNLGNLPLCDDLIPISSNRVCLEYPTEILFCNVCKTAHHKYQVDKELLFPETYHYRARFTSDVLDGMKELVDSLINQYGKIKDKLVLDVGCNDGSLLNEFKKYGAKTLGVEPTGAYKEALDTGHNVLNKYLTYDTAKSILNNYGKIDIITFTNVFAHIDDLKSLINSLSMLIKEDTVIIVENHYLGSVLNSNQFDTFYHEHPRSYSLSSFKYIAKALNLKISHLEFPSRYGGNIRIFMSNLLSENSEKNIINEDIFKSESLFLEKFMTLNLNIKKWRNAKKLQILSLVKKYGKLSGKAFPGRAAILIKMLDLSVNEIECVYEKVGSKKLNHFVPGTRIPIKSDDDLFTNYDSKKPILNLAWHIPDEIKKYLITNGFNSEIVNIIEKTDFN